MAQTSVKSPKTPFPKHPTIPTLPLSAELEGFHVLQGQKVWF